MEPSSVEMAHLSSAARSEVSALSEDSTHAAGHASMVSAIAEEPVSFEKPFPARRPTHPLEARSQTPISQSWPMPPEAGPSSERTSQAGPSRPRGQLPETTTSTAAGNDAMANLRTDTPSFRMFSLGENSRVLGAGHLILNALRALTMIGLAAVMTASWAMIVLSAITGNFYFFDLVTHLFVSAISAILFLSELNLKWFRGWFARNWPVLGPEHSLAWLGVALIIIGCEVLGDLVKPAYTTGTIGLAWWRVIVAAGILSITFGFFNMIASVVFRVPQNRITARQIRSQGSLAPQASVKSINDDLSHTTFPAAAAAAPHRDNWSARSWSNEKKDNDDEAEPSRMRRFTKVLNPRNLRRSRIEISRPIMPLAAAAGDVDCERGVPVVAADRASPILPDVQRPPTALHPAFTGGSRYSEAHMSRF